MSEQAWERNEVVWRQNDPELSELKRAIDWLVANSDPMREFHRELFGFEATGQGGK